MQTSLRLRRWGLLTLLLLLAGALGAFGQAIDGNLVGTVVDAQGAAVVGAEVTATNAATNVGATTKTNGSGEYRFDHLLVGTYRVTTKMTGFKALALQVDVQLNQTTTRNVTLQPGAVSETIEVSGVAPTIDTTTSQLQTTYENELLKDLPSTANSAGSGVLNASLLEAGVGSTGGLGAGSGPSVGGQRPRENNFTIEGTANNDKGVTGPLVYVPNDAVSEFTVITNQFSPEFGHSAGGQFNQVINSGTNSIHGKAYEYMQNRNLNALDVKEINEQIFKLPRYDNNRFGGQVGGPIFKNKLFYFANFEYNPVGEASVPSSPIAPTSAGWSTASGVAGVSANNIAGFSKYATAPSACTAAQIAQGICPAQTPDRFCPINNGTPINTPAGYSPIYDYTTTYLCTPPEGGTPFQAPTPYYAELGVIPVAAGYYVNTRALTTSMDYILSDRDQIRGRYIYNRVVGIDNAAELPQFFMSTATPYHLVTIGEYHTFSPNITNEFRVGFNRVAGATPVPGFPFPGLDAFPNLTVDELNLLNVGPDPNGPQYATQNTYQLVDNFSWTKGNHSFKFGMDALKQIDPQLFIQRSRGDYEWDYLDVFVHDQYPTGIDERSFGSVGYNGDDWGIGWYANDVWKATRNLSLNFGLRYEFLKIPYGWSQQSLNAVASDPALINFAAPTAPKHDFMPRIGFAYSPGTSGKTSIRGGFGMGYDILYDNIGTLSRPPQIGFTVDCPGNSVCPNPSGGFLAQGGIPPQHVSGISTYDQADARALTSAYLPDNVKYPYAESWSLGIQHVFGEYTVEVRYVGSRGIHLPVQNRLNIQNIVNSTPGNFVPEYLQPPSQATINSLSTVVYEEGNCPPSVCPSGAGDTPGSLFYQYYDLGNFFVPAYLNDGFYSLITSYQPWGLSNYHGLATQLTRRLTKGLQFQAAWTWSHTLDNSTADFHSTDISPRRPQDFRDLSSEYGNSLLDHEHRVTVEVLYDVPWFAHDSNWLKKNLLGNYEFIPVFTWESGQWGTVQSGIDSNLNVDAAGDRAIYNPGGQKGVGSDVSPVTQNNVTSVCAYPPCVMGWQAVNPNAQYIVAGYGVIANSSRGNMQTPPINNFDMTAGKHFKFGERYELDFLASAFNLLNHPQFTTGYVNDIFNYGNTGAVRDIFIPSSPNFDKPAAILSSHPRTMQLSLKFSF